MLRRLDVEGDSGAETLGSPVAAVHDDLDEFGGVGLLNCPRCLVRLQDAGTAEHPYLECASCGMVRMTA